MRPFIDSVREAMILKSNNRLKGLGCAALILSTAHFTAIAQVPAAPAQQESSPAASSNQPSQTAVAPVEPAGLAAAWKGAPHSPDGSITEEQIRQLLVGKTLFLRGTYLDNTLDFDQQGKLTGSSPRGSYTLSGVRINKVKFSKHRMQLEGDRYALHFLGELPHQDPLKDVDRVKITPKKKVVRISIDREQVEKPKKEKHKDKGKQQASEGLPPTQVASAAPAPPNPAVQDAVSQPSISDTSRESKQSSITTSPAHASQVLVNALDRVFAPEIDNRMIAEMPDFWRLYYKAAAANTDYVPADPGVLRQSAVDQKAKLLSTVEPPSNELAQSNGVAGMALYHAIVGGDGKVEEVVAGRPIGFGLDEGAVEAIRKAKFQPAVKEGKPVPVALDLVVAFRIYSNRTSQAAAQTVDGPAQPVLPGPYSVQQQ